MTNSLKSINFGNSTLQIRRFDMNNLKDHATIVAIGKRGRGKSVVIKEILRLKSSIPGGVIMSPTERLNCTYGDFIPQLYIHYTYEPEIIEKILYRQEEMVEKERRKNAEGKKIDPRAFLVMDDMMAKKKSWISDECISNIFMNGRHYKLMFILAMQFSLGITPELRNNIDYIFLFGDDVRSNLERIYKHYAGVFPNFDSFAMVFSDLTDNHGCMVIDNKVSSKRLQDKIFWYRADPTVKVEMLGCKQYRDINDDNFDPNWQRRKQTFDINNAISSRSRKKVNMMVERVM